MNRPSVLPSSPSPSRYVRLEGGGDDRPQREARKGYVPVMVGGEGVMIRERFQIPTQFLAHPSIIALLEMSANEFGYGQEGVLRIPCDPDGFRVLLKTLSLKKS